MRSSAHPGMPSAPWLSAYRRLSPGWRALWPGSLEGLKNLPADDAYLLVANHSGIGLCECVTLLAAWTDCFGEARPLAAMAHSSLFEVPVLGDALRGFGVVEATLEGAAAARAKGAPLLLFPGGEHESMRPFWEARQVDFAERRGWIRLARQHGLTIVPLAITGSHLTIPNLGRAKAPAWMTALTGVRCVPVPLLSAVAALSVFASTRGSATRKAVCAFAAYSALALVPWVPARIGFHLLAPVIDVGQSEEEIYAQVVSAVAAQLAESPLR